MESKYIINVAKKVIRNGRPISTFLFRVEEPIRLHAVAVYRELVARFGEEEYSITVTHWDAVGKGVDFD